MARRGPAPGSSAQWGPVIARKHPRMFPRACAKRVRRPSGGGDLDDGLQDRKKVLDDLIRTARTDWEALRDWKCKQFLLRFVLVTSQSRSPEPVEVTRA